MSTAARRPSMICAQTLSALGLNQLSDYGIIDGDHGRCSPSRAAGAGTMQARMPPRM
jgi:hypothetical protein